MSENKDVFFIFPAALLVVLRQLSNPATKVYCYLLENYSAGTHIAISVHLRTVIGKEIKLGPGTVANTLTELLKNKLIYSTGIGVYKINPRFAFQGSPANRDKLLRLVLETECSNC